jgi:hypothetical protein
MGSESEQCQHSKTAQVNRGERAVAAPGAPELNREAGTEQQREGSVGLAFDQTPDQRAQEIVQSARLGRAGMEMDDEHSEQRAAAQDVEGCDAIAGGRREDRVDRER